MKPLVINIFSISSADVGTRLIGFLAITYLARAFGPENMGILSIGMAVLTYASIISTMGLPALGVRSVSAKNSSTRYLVKQISSARFFLSIFSFLVSMGVLMIWVKEQNIKNISIFYLFSMFPSALMLEWLFQGLSKMKILGIGRILGMSVYLLIIIGVVSNSQNIYWVPFAWCLGLIVQTIYLWISYNNLCRYDNNENRPLYLYKIIKQSLPLGIAGFISHSIIQFPIIYLGFFDTTENTGIYSIAFRAIIMMLVIDRVFYTIFFPAISRSYKDSIEKLKELVIWTLKIVTTVSIFVAIIFLIAGEYLFPILFGPKYTDSTLIFQILLIYFVLTIINSVFTFTLIGIKKEQLYTKSIFISAVAFAAIFFIPSTLPVTIIVAVSLTVNEAVSMLMMIIYLRKSIFINLFYRVTFPLSIGLVFALFVCFLQNYYLLFFSVIAAVFSLPSLAIVTGINRSDINTLKNLIK